MGGSRRPGNGLPGLLRWGLVAFSLGMLGLHRVAAFPYAELGASWLLTPAVGFVLVLLLVLALVGCVVGRGGLLAAGLMGGALVTGVACLAKVVAAGWAFPEILEYAARFSFPLLGLALLSGVGDLRWPMRIVLAATFAGHGLYALGWPCERPAAFVELVHGTIGLEATSNSNFLTIVGVLDLTASVALLVPRTERIALFYMLVWGFATALARPWAGIDGEQAAASWLHTIPEFLFRVPHFVLPAFLLLGSSARRSGGQGGRRLDVSRL